MKATSLVYTEQRLHNKNLPSNHHLLAEKALDTLPYVSDQQDSMDFNVSEIDYVKL